VRRCVFRGNENGILGGNYATNTALIEHSEFVDNGHGNVGYTHNLYIGAIDRLTFQGNWSHAMWAGGADIGHLLKSRAQHNLVRYNRLTAEDAPSSYEINLPQGGEAYVIGNLIQQRVGGQRIMISFGDGDGTQYTGSALYVVNNTLVSESAGDATFVRTTQPDAQVHVVNNLVVGPGTLISGGVPTMAGNLATTTPGLVDQAGFDYHLAAGAAAINAGVDPGTAPTMALTPASQYVHPRALESRASVGALDVGAYEYGNVPTGGDAGATGGDAETTGAPSKSGCGCQSDGDGAGAGLVVVVGVVGVVIGRRRRR
jgi:MYXO-CTERM domain-containing protein